MVYLDHTAFINRWMFLCEFERTSHIFLGYEIMTLEVYQICDTIVNDFSVSTKNHIIEVVCAILE